MEAVAAGAGVIAFLQLADKAITVCSRIIDTIKDAPRDIVIISLEIQSLKNILSGLEACSVARTLEAANGPIAMSHDCLQKLCDLLPSDADVQALNSDRKLKVSIVTLAWPLKESKARRLLAEISHHKATLLLGLAGNIAFVPWTRLLLEERLIRSRRDVEDIKAGVGRLEHLWSEMAMDVDAVGTRVRALQDGLSSMSHPTSTSTPRTGSC
jgi:hypothetical protein